ncbi:unnamed protein product [Calypogeia fissa]
MELSMSSIHHWARAPKPMAEDLGFDPNRDMSFSWSGLKLFVDLQIDPNDPQNDGQTSVTDHNSVQEKDREDDYRTKEIGSTSESGSLQHDSDGRKGHLLLTNDQHNERFCKDQEAHEPDVDRLCGAASAETDRNWTQCTWPDWGEPLPPEDPDDDPIEVDYAAEGERNPSTSKKSVTFCDVVTVVEPSSQQEEREAGSFSYAGSSDEELEQGTDQVTSSSDGNSSDLSPSRVSCSTEKESLNSADVSAACHLLELGNELANYGNSKAIGFESPGGSGKRKSDFYDPSSDLDRLSELVEKLYAALPQLSNIVSDSQGSGSSKEAVGSWTIEISKHSGLRLRMKRIKPRKQKQAELEDIGVLDLEDDINEVLERPPWKRQYKSLTRMS